MNTVGPEQVLKGIAEVRDGRTFALSLPLDRPRGGGLSAHRLPPIVRPTLRAGHVNANCPMAVAYPGASDIVSDDLVVLHTQFSTQWDAFAHIGAHFDADGDGDPEVVHYNGWRGAGDVVAPTDPARAGLSSLGDVAGAETGTASTYDAGPVDISHLARHGVQGRAVLVDLEEHFGCTRRTVGYDGLHRAMESHGASLEAGDILLLHTGFARAVLAGTSPDDASCGRGSAPRAWRPSPPTTTRSRSSQRRVTARVHRSCRCTSCASSCSASTSASCGGSPTSPSTCDRTAAPGACSPLPRCTCLGRLDLP
jgi:hypothetical protein